MPTSWLMPWQHAVKPCKRSNNFEVKNSLSLCFDEAHGKGCFFFSHSLQDFLSGVFIGRVLFLRSLGYPFRVLSGAKELFIFVAAEQ